MAGFTSESDFNTIIAGEEQRDLSYYFSSLTTDINRASKNPQVPAVKHPARSGEEHEDFITVPRVRVHFF